MLVQQKLIAFFGEIACAIIATLANRKYTCTEIACVIKSNEDLLNDGSGISLSHL